MSDLAATKAIFVDHKPLQSRSVGRLIFEVPIEQYDAALGALGGTPLPGESRWFAIARLTKQPTGHAIVGSAPSPSADAADSPAAAPMSPLHKAIAHLYEDGGSTEREAEFYPSDPRPARQTLQAQARGAAEPATKPKKHWDDYSPSQQAGMACKTEGFRDWATGLGPIRRFDGSELSCAKWTNNTLDLEGWTSEYVRWYCGVSSRSELDTNPEAAKRWRELHGMFQADTQYGDRR